MNNVEESSGLNIASEILSDITIHMKYAKYIPSLNRRETWDELVARNMNMHINKFPELEQEIKDNYKFVYLKKILPSMRSMQFAGKSIEICPSRIYNCFGRETEFITSEGLKSFYDFSNGDIIKVLTHEGNWKSAIVRNYGKQQLNRISFHRGRSEKIIRATKNHNWILFDGSKTSDLTLNDCIYSPPRSTSFDYDKADVSEKLYWCYGYVFGDGTKVKSDGEYKYSMVRLCGADASKYAYRFEEMGFSSSSSLSLKGDIIVYTGKYLKTIPDIYIDGLSLISAFMDGYLTADGYKNSDWHSNKNVSKYKDIMSSQEDHIDFLHQFLDMCGYYIVNTKDLTGEETNLGIRGTTSRFYITNRIGTQKNFSWSVKGIVEDSIEDVWCLEVEDDHSFVLSGGIVTGNCAFAPIDDYRVFSEIMFLLLGGTGIGYSVQNHHIDKLPEIRKPFPGKTRRFLIGDSIEGWSDAISVLVKAYFLGSSKPQFDFRDIRAKGSRLVTSGGKAPGPRPLKECLIKIEGIFESKKNGDKLTSLECHDIVCHIADAVLAGGIRRAALLCLFSATDVEMLGCKSGNWWETNPQRGRANNSVNLMRHKISKQYFLEIWDRIKKSGSGEPGIYLSNDKDFGCNPCNEVSLRPFQFCNLVEINGGTIVDQDDFNFRAKAASFIATLQASYTDFHYLRPIWKRTTEKEALLGVSLTGISSGIVLDLNMETAANVVVSENKRVASIIKINPAARTTVVKPAGTTSLVLGTSSGIHAWHNNYYIRRMRVGKNEPIYTYLSIYHPNLLEDEYFRPHDTAIISIPQKAPEGAILRSETAIDLLERIKKVHDTWIKPGHVGGSNTHNVSATISVKSNEWDIVGEWMWKYRDTYNGLSVLPFSDHTYIQAPFEDCTKEKYDELFKSLVNVDLSKVVELDDNTNLTGEVACAGGACTVITL